MVFLCPRDKFTHISRHALYFNPLLDLFREISQDNSVWHSTTHFTFESCVPVWLVIGLDLPWLVVVVHNAEVGDTFRSGIDSGGSGRSCRCQKRVSSRSTL